MRQVIKTIALFSLPLFVACGGGSKAPVNEAPSTVNLSYPTPNLLCIDNTIVFEWSDATDANNDEITYSIAFSDNREMSNIIKTETVSTSKKSIKLDKGTAYYWNVTAIDSKGKSGEPSSVSAFYTKGSGETNTAPFTAELISPTNDESVTSGTVNLKWKGADSNTTDVLKYDVYFSENTTPDLKTSSLETALQEVTVESGKTYYWQVNTIDASGAKSIGQVWSFNVK